MLFRMLLGGKSLFHRNRYLVSASSLKISNFLFALSLMKSGSLEDAHAYLHTHTQNVFSYNVSKEETVQQNGKSLGIYI